MKHIENPWVLCDNPFDQEGPDVLYTTIYEINIYIDCDYTDDQIEMTLLGDDGGSTKYEEFEPTRETIRIYNKDLEGYGFTGTIAEMGIEKAERVGEVIFNDRFYGCEM